jgi:hypothetical protein
MAKTTTTAKAVAHKNTTSKAQQVCKPSEIVSAMPIKGRSLSLPAVKAYNLMLGQAQAAGFENRDYCISKRELRRSHKGNERLDGILHELHSIALEMKCTTPDGESGVLCTPLLSSTIRKDGDDDTGNVWFCFPEKLMQIIQASEQWSILLSQVMIGFKSLYALRLYEYGCMYHRRDEPFLWWSPDELRKAFGVPEGAYNDWAGVRHFVLKPALAEVNELAEEFFVEMPEDKIQRRGRKVTRFCLVFKSKAKPAEEPKTIEHEPAAKRVQTDLDAAARALRLLDIADIMERTRWYEAALQRGCREIPAATAKANLKKWVTWITEDILAEQRSAARPKRIEALVAAEDRATDPGALDEPESDWGDWLRHNGF